MHIGMSACQQAVKMLYKKGLEFKNNAVCHTTFSGWLACQPGPLI